MSSKKSNKSKNENENENKGSASPAGKHLQSTLDNQRDSQTLVGVSAAVITPDEKWLGVSGISSETEHMSADMLFGIGSVTKTYTAALALQLIEEGKFSLDDVIGTWLPPIQYIGSGITIRQLLNNTSGLHNYMEHPDFYQSLFASPDKMWTPEELFSTFLLGPLYEPGDNWNYSATNYILLGMIMKEVTKSEISKELRNRFFNPLKLDNTFLYPEETYLLERLAHVWMDIDGSGTLVDLDTLMPGVPPTGFFSSVWTAGALHSTAEDVATWGLHLFGAGVLKKSSLEDMVTPAPQNKEFQYGFSIFIDRVGDMRTYWHTGGLGYTSIMYCIPDESVSIAVLCNCEADTKSIACALYDAYKSC